MDRRLFLQGVVATAALGTGLGAGLGYPRPLLAQTADDRGAPRTLGDPDAAVTIEEYSSLTCPHCRSFHLDTLPRLKSDYIEPGKVKLIYYDFPFDQAALRAAMLARCAPPQRYFQFLDVLFAQQPNWANENFIQNLRAIGAVGGVSGERFDACMNDEALLNAVVAQRFEGERNRGVNSTPDLLHLRRRRRHRGHPRRPTLRRLQGSDRPQDRRLIRQRQKGSFPDPCSSPA